MSTALSTASISIPFWKRGRQPARHHRGAGDAVGPAIDLAVLQAGGQQVAIDRTVDIMLDVLFARVDDLDRTIDMLGDAHGLDRHVGLQPAAEAAAQQMLIAPSPFPAAGRAPPATAGLDPRHDLRADPQFAAVWRDMGRAVRAAPWWHGRGRAVHRPHPACRHRPVPCRRRRRPWPRRPSGRWPCGCRPRSRWNRHGRWRPRSR